jgi:cytochrome c biogenesis protein CcmG/thiol:disulfide interchange protein DsbE
VKPALRTLSVVGALVLLAFGYVRMSENKGYALRKGSEAPAFRLASLAGGRGELAALRGKVVVLNFWATWCAPCVSEMPSLERLHRTLGPEGLAVVTVATDDDDADVRRFVTERGLTMPVLRDPGGGVASDSYHTTGYPETFVLDRTGVVLEHVVGPAEWDSPEWAARFRALLGPRQAASAGAARPAAP